jgi:hydrogenase maturation protein HypF
VQSTFKIQIKGQVQGVGFRPFVFGLAHKHNYFGKVFNNEEGVVVYINSSKENANAFVSDLINNAPKVSIIVSHDITSVDFISFDDFKIIASPKTKQLNLPLTPDFAICTECKNEISDSKNRRFQYPFTTCVSCGPRYAITTKYPFERAHTSLLKFEMCNTCHTEYTLPDDRRFHSQTNSCSECGIKLKLTDNLGKNIEVNQQDIIIKVAKYISQGYIVAIKNTNGYVLCCDATDVDAIQQLRIKKKRLTKPFAVLYPTIKAVKNDFNLTDKEREALQSNVAPIVILQNTRSLKLATNAIAPNLNQIGVMLPSSGLLQLLMNELKSPIIATSGNIHGSPIISNEKEAEKELKSVADYFLHHTMEIQFPQDDSVLKYANNDQIILRRSRGLAPNYLGEFHTNIQPILAMGAHLKSTFSFVPNTHTYVSQYFGNLDSYEVSERYKNTLKQYINLFETTPKVILVDKHHQYQSTIVGNDLAAHWKAKLIDIQHHKAHFASVLGEHNLFESEEKLLGVIWDGTGLGDDDAIWGGEFFIYENHNIDRLTHFEYFNWIANDKMAQEPRLSLLSLLNENERPSIREKFTETEWKIYIKTLQSNTHKTSSVGRLFDAIASLLGLIDVVTFEGEAAMILEQCAVNYKHSDYSNLLDDIDYTKVPTQLIIQKAKEQFYKGDSIEKIAASFMYTLAKCIVKIALEQQVKTIVCSGGVFQNAFLLNQLRGLIDNTNLNLKINRKLSCNDENISFGQLMYYLNIKP